MVCASKGITWVLVGEQGKEVGRLLCVHVCKRGFGSTCEEKCKIHTGGYIFKTKSIELPNQKKKKRKENGHLSFRTKINDNRYLL